MTGGTGPYPAFPAGSVALDQAERSRVRTAAQDAVVAFATDVDRPRAQVIRPFHGVRGGGDPGSSHFLIMVKPHALDFEQGVDVAQVIDVVLETLREWSVAVGGLLVASSAHIARYDLIRSTYRTLNLVARRGPEALSSLAAARLVEFCNESPGGVEVSGAYPFLDQHPEIGETGLCLLANNLPTHKLAAGAYVSTFDHFGATQMVLNAFHPYQWRTLTRPGRSVIAIECWSQRSFHDFRENMIGGIFPNSAVLGSIRRSLFERRDVLGIPHASPQVNYVHISPGPLEGAHHLASFFSVPDLGSVVPWETTNMGALLTEAGVRWDAEWVGSNPEVIFESKTSPLFDLSEDADTAAVLEIAKAVRILR